MARTFKPDTRGLETTLDWDVNKLDISNEHGKCNMRDTTGSKNKESLGSIMTHRLTPLTCKVKELTIT